MDKKSVYIETYGCQMNFSDTEIVCAILQDAGYHMVNDYKLADFIFMNTCSIRDHAEQRVFNRLQEFSGQKKRKPLLKIGLLGCMAERLKEQLLTEAAYVDIIVGPDAYRDLPSLLSQVACGDKAINVLLSEEETYAEIAPVRIGDNQISAFISIMRGCENYCAYCVVPYTRGKERSREAQTIVHEAEKLFEQGYREITLLGQNVNSYKDGEVNFAKLLAMVASVNPLLRVRFATSHPKDLSDELLQTIAGFHNICKAIHLPVQSGSSDMLKKMNRKYDRAWYLDRIAAIREIIPECSISTDVIVGFSGETEEDYQETLSLFKEVGYEFAFMFKYSERAGTYASKHYPDDIPEDIKNKRLEEIIACQQNNSLKSNQMDIGKTFEVLVEGPSKRSKDVYFGRNSQNKVVVFPRLQTNIGDYVQVQIEDCTAATLKGKIVQ